MSIVDHVILSLCTLIQYVDVYEFDTYYPDHLNLESEDDWTIYAEKV